MEKRLYCEMYKNKKTFADQKSTLVMEIDIRKSTYYTRVFSNRGIALSIMAEFGNIA